MSRADEYWQQASWRPYAQMIACAEQALPSKSFAGLHVLDLGCGVGATTKILADKGANVVGIDADPEMIALARRKFPGIEFECVAVETWEPHRRFDVVWSSFVLAYCGDVASTLETWGDLLNPGGLLIWCAHSHVARCTAALTRGGRSVEINGLFSPHVPLERAHFFKQFETDTLMQHGYNAFAGGEMMESAQNARCYRERTLTEWADPELAQEPGPVPPDSPVWKGWEARFERLAQLFLEADAPANAKDLFFNCLAHSEHRCKSRIVMMTARKLALSHTGNIDNDYNDYSARHSAGSIDSGGGD